MKRIGILLVLLNILVCKIEASNTYHRITSNDADKILQVVSNNLNNLRKIRFNYELKLNYFSDNYFKDINANVFIDFGSIDTLTGFTFQIDNKNSKVVFNGAEKFETDKKAKTIAILNQPDKNQLNSITYLENSLPALRNTLPLIIKDGSISKTQADTSIDGKSFYLLNITLHKQLINRLGGFFPLSNERNIIYKLIVDETNYLPFKIVQKNNLNDDFTEVTFSHFEVSPMEPEEYTACAD